MTFGLWHDGSHGFTEVLARVLVFFDLSQVMLSKHQMAATDKTFIYAIFEVLDSAVVATIIQECAYCNT